MAHVQPGVAPALFRRGDVGFHGAAAPALVDECGQRRIAGRGGGGQRMLGRDRHEGHAKERVHARGVDLQALATAGGAVPEGGERVLGVGKGHVAPFAPADPVRLHGAHALGPFREPRQGLEQFLRVLGDAQVVHRNLALFDQRASPPAVPVDDLLVGEHGLIDRIPVDDAGLLVGNAALAHAQEQPLVPAVVVRIAGGQFAAPVEAEPQGLQLLLHVGDVLARPARGRHAVGDGRVLGRQAEGVPAHRLQHVHALHAHVTGQRIADRVISHVAHVQAARRVGKHRQAVELATPGFLTRHEAGLSVPIVLGGALDGGRFVSFLHGRAVASAGQRWIRPRIHEAAGCPCGRGSRPTAV